MIRKMHPLWVWGLILLLCLLVSGGGSAALSIYYTTNLVKHECDALTLLTAMPVPKPHNPKANPSREQNYRFYLALVEWKKADGC